jgi:anaerobic ribonucleoside-triphosphate reductase activating protein
MELRIHSLIRRSRVNGPGERFVLWVQGCTHHCPGCFNPETHDPKAGTSDTVDRIAQEILSVPGIEGVTLSGGEPFQQAAALVELCRRVRVARLSVFIFTGYTLDEIRASDDPAMADLLSLADIVVAGRFIQSRKRILLWRGSDNQIVHFLSNRYSPKDYDVDGAPDQIEITVDEAGNIRLTGFPPDDLRRGLTTLSKPAPNTSPEQNRTDRPSA